MNFYISKMEDLTNATDAQIDHLLVSTEGISQRSSSSYQPMQEEELNKVSVMSEEAPPNKEPRQPQPTDNKITDYVIGEITNSEPWKDTMNMLKDVYTDGINFDQDNNPNLFEEIEWAPTTAQAERMHKFLEENPEIVLGTADIDREKSPEISPKWEAVVTELNSLGKNEDKPASYWAQYWAKMNNDIQVILAHRENPTPESPAYMIHPLSEVMEKMIVLVQKSIALQNDMNAEAAVNDRPAAKEASAAASRRVARRNARRNRRREEARNVIAMLQSIGNQEEGNPLETGRLTVEKLSIYSDSVAKLTEFVSGCGTLIRRNQVPN